MSKFKTAYYAILKSKSQNGPYPSVNPSSIGLPSVTRSMYELRLKADRPQFQQVYNMLFVSQPCGRIAVTGSVLGRVSACQSCHLSRVLARSAHFPTTPPLLHAIPCNVRTRQDFYPWSLAREVNYPLSLAYRKASASGSQCVC